METVNIPEVWAGVECTINRVGDQYFNQLERSGHSTRLEDLDRFAALGIKKIRYPVLWEQTSPGEPEDADWSWADQRLNRLRQLGLTPIVGFVHHGSGPRHTSLVDPAFPDKLAKYAEAFATRYPWIKYFTPVNEPLTTARFSGLYGHWYPHGKDNATFARALVTQCKAVCTSMEAIRKKIPEAQLIQTEDICKVYSTQLLAYQAAYENERRWLSLDLLCGLVSRNHPMWNVLLAAGITPAELEWFSRHACPPDIIGVNHYLTSNRFLDEKLDKYPTHYHGGNQRHTYADVEAISVELAEAGSIYSLLKEVWHRYHLPIAITEAHLCSTREEQLRWLWEFWNAANLLCKENVIIKAVTAWALLGSFDWNCLVTRQNGYYESGVFDLRGGAPRPTALADMIGKMAGNVAFKHPLLEIPGFWRRPGDLASLSAGIPPVLIMGGNEDLANAFTRHCTSRRIPYQLLSTEDAKDATSIFKIFELYKPWAVINAAGTEDPVMLAGICRDKAVQLMTFSSESERLVLQVFPEALVIRTSCLFVSPTYIPDLVDACLDLLIDRERGIRHECTIINQTPFDICKTI